MAGSWIQRAGGAGRSGVSRSHSASATADLGSLGGPRHPVRPGLVARRITVTRLSSAPKPDPGSLTSLATTTSQPFFQLAASVGHDVMGLGRKAHKERLPGVPSSTAKLGQGHRASALTAAQ